MSSSRISSWHLPWQAMYLKPVQPWLPFDPGAEAWADGLLASIAGPARRAHQSRRGMGRQALAGRALRRRRAGADRPRLSCTGQCRPRRRAVADVIVKQTRGGATPLAPSLENLIALTRRVALVIAGDTGPLHLACALGKPVVGIYGPTDPRRNGPFGTRFKVLRSPESRRDHSPDRNPGSGPVDDPTGRGTAGGRRAALCRGGPMSSANLHPNARAMERWQSIARRIRVPLGFLVAALYVFELWRRAPVPSAIGMEPCLGAPGTLAARLCCRLCQKES